MDIVVGSHAFAKVNNYAGHYNAFKDLMTPAMVETYRDRWRAHLESVRAAFSPDVIHVHHIWILGSLVRDVFGEVPIVNHCHATGLRQMQLAPHLAGAVVAGCRRNDRFAVEINGLPQRQCGGKCGQ